MSKSVFPKFVKSTTPYLKLKSITIIPKGKLGTYPILSHVASSFHYTSSCVLPLPSTFSLICHHCGEYGHLGPNPGKLTSHPSVIVNVMLLILLLPFLCVLLLRVRDLNTLNALYICAIYVPLLSTFLGSVLDISRVSHGDLVLVLFPLSS